MVRPDCILTACARWRESIIQGAIIGCTRCAIASGFVSIAVIILSGGA